MFCFIVILNILLISEILIHSVAFLISNQTFIQNISNVSLMKKMNISIEKIMCFWAQQYHHSTVDLFPIKIFCVMDFQGR